MNQGLLMFHEDRGGGHGNFSKYAILLYREASSFDPLDQS